MSLTVQKGDSVEINWDEITSLITAGNAKLSSLAVQLSVPSADLKAEMLRHYGEGKLLFKRGRKGGVYFVEGGVA